MAESFNKFLDYVNNGKNFQKIFIFLVVFLCVVKLPTLFSTDIQPWDEGMYASRVLSIHQNGDFWDQSVHSVGGFYSGSHPPLLIWIGYVFTLALGTSAWVFKIIPFLFGLGCIYLIMRLGEKLFDLKTGFFAALIFSSNLIFNIFAKRFQFDIPYTFLILLAFYFFTMYMYGPQKKYIYFTGIVLGLCLMIKILVGFYIPIILFGFYLLKRKEIPFKLNDLIILTAVGVVIALPWHLYMISTYGNEFLHYFMGFHILDRAFIGVEENVKGSGPLYHINYFLSILPFSIIVFFSLVKDARKFRYLSWQKILIWVWFLSGLVITALFRTKLEVYVLLFLIPGCYLIPLYLYDIKKGFTVSKLILFCAVIFNTLWMASFYYRQDIRHYIAESSKIFILLMLVVSVILVIAAGYFFLRRFSLSNSLLVIIVLFFFGANIFFLVKPPSWEVEFDLSSVKKEIDNSGRKKIMYVGTNYRHNPQFTFYFNGLNVGWENDTYSYDLIDLKDGADKVKEKITSLGEDYSLIVEKDNINRSTYTSSSEFIPAGYKLIKKTGGYELYQK